MAVKCIACNEPANEITDKQVGDWYFHPKCFNCSNCKQYIEMSAKFFKHPDKSRVGAIVCEPCKNLLLPKHNPKSKLDAQGYQVKVPTMQSGGAQCFQCNKTVTDVDKLVAMGNIYHTKCFTCSKCSKLLPQAEYESKDKKPFCKACFAKE
ncbi:Cysteine and glycine-rich protein 1 [Boothiomyces sp. JEL0866]|nr:Cysteine and glycine-rich protein 1 [Boothiomyces sp. JEL0866]KAJ3318246.1 Cysteine and glycine-rich protein 1 [Boothiomyces sp. JEL0866]